jgi:aminopeptidase
MRFGYPLTVLDPRGRKVAALLVDYSTRVRRDERVLIRADVAAREFVLELYRLVLQRGAHVLDIDWLVPDQQKTFYSYARKHQLERFPDHLFYEIKRTDVFFAIRAPEDLRELEGVPPEKIGMWARTVQRINEWRVDRTRWVLFQYPTQAAAEFAGMSLREFEDFVYGACLLDWEQLRRRMQKFKRRMERTDEVRIVGWETDLTLSIKGRRTVVSGVEHNMPGGEVFTSVVDDSANGHIVFDIPAVHLGNIVEGVRLEFRDGVVVGASAERNEAFLRSILSTDEGAKRIGELGIGLNYNITRPVNQILFDEKIGGTIHVAMGRAYKETAGRNQSAIHWDFIKDLRRDGRIYFDGELVMENGRWLL